MDSTDPRLYVLDTNVLIHDPQAPLNFQEHVVIIPMLVLEELDHLKAGKLAVAADCRQAIRLIDRLLGNASPEEVAVGVPILRPNGRSLGFLAVLMGEKSCPAVLPEDCVDNRIINQAVQLANDHRYDAEVVLVSKDINMRLKARGCGLQVEDYHTDQLVDDVDLLPKGFHCYPGSFWDRVPDVETRRCGSETLHTLSLMQPTGEEGVERVLQTPLVNEFILDECDFVGWVQGVTGSEVVLQDLSHAGLMHQEVWGLKPRDIHQALALYALLDPDIHLVNLTGAAGSGKTILALAAAIEQAMVMKRYRHIIVTRSVQGLDEEIGFLPGTETEKMLPWLGAITDNLEALHLDDQSPSGSIDYLLQKVPIQFKSLNYIRGRSFQQSLIIVDECQNLTPHQMKTIITRAGQGSKVVCLGNLAQIDTPYLSAPSSGLTFLTERFKNCPLSVHITLQGVPRSALAEFAEAHL